MPGGISPLGWLPSLNDIGFSKIGHYSLTGIMNNLFVREAWIGVFLITVIWLLTRPQGRESIDSHDSSHVDHASLGTFRHLG